MTNKNTATRLSIHFRSCKMENNKYVHKYASNFHTCTVARSTYVLALYVLSAELSRLPLSTHRLRIAAVRSATLRECAAVGMGQEQACCTASGDVWHEHRHRHIRLHVYSTKTWNKKNEIVNETNLGSRLSLQVILQLLLSSFQSWRFSDITWLVKFGHDSFLQVCPCLVFCCRCLLSFCVPLFLFLISELRFFLIIKLTFYGLPLLNSFVRIDADPRRPLVSFRMHTLI